MNINHLKTKNEAQVKLNNFKIDTPILAESNFQYVPPTVPPRQPGILSQSPNLGKINLQELGIKLK